MTETKLIGSSRARKQVQRMTVAVLRSVKSLTPTEGAGALGLDVNDVRNMRSGNKISVPMVVKLINVGHFTPESILSGRGLEMNEVGHKRARRPGIDRRIKKLSWMRPGKEWAKLTGLSVTGAYALRYMEEDVHVTLYTILGFIHAGHSIDEIVLGVKT